MNVTKITLIAFAITAFSCTISMMHVFMSGAVASDDVRALISLQTIAAPIALLVFAVDLALRARDGGVKVALAQIWNATPAWAVMAILLLNLLVLIGELALVIRVRLSGEPAFWFEHAPLACALTCSLAFCAIYARAYPSSAGSSAAIKRW